MYSRGGEIRRPQDTQDGKRPECQRRLRATLTLKTKICRRFYLFLPYEAIRGANTLHFESSNEQFDWF